MKRKLLPLAIGAAIAMPGVALAGPTVYGKVNVTVENDDVDLGNDSADQWEVNSNASRLGVKGSEKISDTLKAVYKLEYQIDVDAGDDVFKQRNIYAGLEGDFGQVIIGNFDTPVKTSQKKIDLFNDYSNGDIKNVVAGENRESNLIQYTTPKMGAIVAKLAIQPGEDRDDGNDATEDYDGLTDGFSLSVAFDQDNLYLALAHDSEISGGFGLNGFLEDLLGEDGFEALEAEVGSLSGRLDTTRLVGQFKIDNVQLGALFQTSEDSDSGDLEETGYILSAAMKAGDNTFKFQYGASELEADGSSDSLDLTQLGLGVDHKLSKQTKVFAHYITRELEVGSADGEITNIAFGMEHKF